MAVPVLLKIGDTEIDVHRRYTEGGFTAVPLKKVSVARSQSGKLFVNNLYEKYTIKMKGLAQELFEDLRFEYRKTSFIDLLSIVNRKEKFNGDGSTTVFTLSRRQRLDDTDALPVAFNPPGVTVTGLTFSNSVNGGLVTFVSPPASGTDNIEVVYFPIINGSITEMSDDFNQFRDEENWDLTFEEE